MEDAYLVAIKIERQHKTDKIHESKCATSTWNKGKDPWESSNSWDEYSKKEFNTQADKSKSKVEPEETTSNGQCKSLSTIRCHNVDSVTTCEIPLINELSLA